MNNLLEIKHLTVHAGDKAILSDVTLAVKKGSITALVGGSGSGKTTTGLAVLGLLSPVLKIINGEIRFGPERIDLLSLDPRRKRALCGRDVGMIFQEPLTAFNPVLRIGEQIEEVLKYHEPLTRDARRRRVFDILSEVGFPDPRRAAGSYPHQLSGGMRQRAMIAQAIVCRPSLLIADEPTSNLDVTLQARIIALFDGLRKRLDLTILLITHDLGMVSRLADEVVVMERGRVVEQGATRSVLSSPRHLYTKTLLEASL
jgi:ABC-type glutathione transport system ATPase component